MPYPGFRGHLNLEGRSTTQNSPPNQVTSVYPSEEGLVLHGSTEMLKLVLRQTKRKSIFAGIWNLVNWLMWKLPGKGFRRFMQFPITVNSTISYFPI